MAVLQKKLDDKVVEVVSMMLQRNSRCKLASEDVLHRVGVQGGDGDGRGPLVVDLNTTS